MPTKPSSHSKTSMALWPTLINSFKPQGYEISQLRKWSFQDVSHHIWLYCSKPHECGVLCNARHVSMPLVFVLLYRYYVFHWWNIIPFHKESKFTQYYFILKKWQHLRTMIQYIGQIKWSLTDSSTLAQPFKTEQRAGSHPKRNWQLVWHKYGRIQGSNPWSLQNSQVTTQKTLAMVMSYDNEKAITSPWIKIK